MRTIGIVLMLCACFLPALNLQAQIPVPPPSAHADTTSVVMIRKADRLRFEKIDSATQLQMLAGNVLLQQENTLFYCDSAVIDNNKGIVEAFGNIHINDADSIHTYSQYLIYYSNERKAYLRKNVKLTDGKGVLTTNELIYDTNLKIGQYFKGGKVVSETTTLTSEEAIYYGDLKDVYFKKNVKMRDPQYELDTDSLLYNTDTRIATFITQTHIRADSGRRNIVTSEGYYDLANKNARFGSRPQIKDGTTYVTGDDVGFDDVTGESYARGNAVFRDTAQGISILANNLQANKINNTLFATEKPLMIIQQKNDSIYVTADTLYSGRLTSIPDYKRTYLLNDTVPVDSAAAEAPTAEGVLVDSTGAPIQPDTLAVQPDSLNVRRDTVAAVPDSLAVVPDSVRYDTLHYPWQVEPTDTTNRNRYFQAFHHVRIFSDSLQAVCDSLFYSGVDSVFRLFKQPVAWASNSQITGDTMYLYTRDKQPLRIRVFENALVVNRTSDNFYNQLKGNTINGYFTEGNVDYMRARGTAESIYYAQDEDSAYAGVNRSTAGVIDMFFRNQELSRVVFRSEVQGTMYPFRQVNHEEMRLRGFQWLESRRPKTKFELFEDAPPSVPNAPVVPTVPTVQRP
ncbi:OstA-like protein [Flavihumibacter solisilvae]|uniref:OstA-like protein n=1 Tax=Flavihumibacter solisilvae TaxID=1349421 RepID=UPI00068B4BA5|nr:OstA-like protein [Flavihumibacter solisilvae]